MQMRQDNFDKLLEQLRRHEGLRLKPYNDSLGVRTIGYGHNMSTVSDTSRTMYEAQGITQAEAEALLRRDITRAVEACMQYKWFESLDDIRKCVVINMMFNLGAQRFAEFKNMHAMLEAQNYSVAASQMVNSRWYKQVKLRAHELVAQMRTGVWQK